MHSAERTCATDTQSFHDLSNNKYGHIVGRGSAIRTSELPVLVIKVEKYYSRLYRLVASRDVPFYAFVSQESDLSLSDRLVR